MTDDPRRAPGADLPEWIDQIYDGARRRAGARRHRPDPRGVQRRRAPGRAPGRPGDHVRRRPRRRGLRTRPTSSPGSRRAIGRVGRRGSDHASATSRPPRRRPASTPSSWPPGSADEVRAAMVARARRRARPRCSAGARCWRTAPASTATTRSARGRRSTCCRRSPAAESAADRAHRAVGLQERSGRRCRARPSCRPGTGGTRRRARRRRRPRRARAARGRSCRSASPARVRPDRRGVGRSDSPRSRSRTFVSVCENRHARSCPSAVSRSRSHAPQNGCGDRRDDADGRGSAVDGPELGRRGAAAGHLGERELRRQPLEDLRLRHHLARGPTCARRRAASAR